MANLLVDVVDNDIMWMALAATENKITYHPDSYWATTAVHLYCRLSVVNNALWNHMRTETYMWRHLLRNLPDRYDHAFCLIEDCMKKQAVSLGKELDQRELVKNICSGNFCLQILQDGAFSHWNNQIVDVDLEPLPWWLGPLESNNEDDFFGGYIHIGISSDPDDFGVYFLPASHRLERIFDDVVWRPIPTHPESGTRSKILIAPGEMVSFASENLQTQRSFSIALKDRYTGFVWSYKDVDDPIEGLWITAPKAGVDDV